MEDLGLFYSHFVNFTAFWYILWSFVAFQGYWHIFPVLVCCTKKNLATLENRSGM
jgi:hypothetical protein